MPTEGEKHVIGDLTFVYRGGSWVLDDGVPLPPDGSVILSPGDPMHFESDDGLAR